MMAEEQLQVGVVLFHDFDLLDVTGPLEIFGVLPSRFRLNLIGPGIGAIRSAQGPELVAAFGFDNAWRCDLALVPGGSGTRALVTDRGFIEWLRGWCRRADLVASVCTGAGLLAATGLLDGYRATSNKRAFSWAVEQGPHVEWIAHARPVRGPQPTRLSEMIVLCNSGEIEPTSCPAMWRARGQRRCRDFGRNVM